MAVIEIIRCIGLWPLLLKVENSFSLQAKAMNLYEACLTLLQVYSKNNLGRQRIDVTAEEDQYQDLLLIMELLTNLLSKEFIDFSDTGRRKSRMNNIGH